MTLTFFFIMAAVSVVSALLVIFNRNVVHSALALLVNFGALAVFYFMLNAQFLAVVQILIYAGAIIVLFLFVVMLLGAELGETVSHWWDAPIPIMVGLGLIMLTVLGTSVIQNPQIFETAGKTGDFTPEAVEEFGQTELISAALFMEHALSIELAAVLLTVGIVGVVWLAQHYRRETEEPRDEVNVL